MAWHNFAWVIVVAIVVVHYGACTFSIIFKVPVWQLVWVVHQAAELQRHGIQLRVLQSQCSSKQQLLRLASPCSLPPIQLILSGNRSWVCLSFCSPTNIQHACICKRKREGETRPYSSASQLHKTMVLLGFHPLFCNLFSLWATYNISDKGSIIEIQYSVTLSLLEKKLIYL